MRVGAAVLVGLLSTAPLPAQEGAAPPAPAPSAPPAAEADAPRPGVLVAGTDVPVPRRTRFVPPEYPPEALARGLRGIVILELVLDEEGRVAEARVTRSVPPFDAAALAAARQWEYEPTRVEGKAVRVLHRLPVTFAQKLPEFARSGGVPELRQGVAPVVPPSAPAVESAMVAAEVRLDREGEVVEAQVTTGEAPWAEALLQAIRTWRFAPEPPAALAFVAEATFRPAREDRPASVEVRLRDARPIAEAGAAPPTAGPPAARPARAPAPAAGPSAPPTVPPGAVAPAAPATEVVPARAPQSRPSPAVEGPGVSGVRDVTLVGPIPDLAKGRRPVVPPLARLKGETGTVRVTFTVDASGATSVQSAEGPALIGEAARQVVASWSFRRRSVERLFLVAEIVYGDSAASATLRRQE